MLSCRRFFLDHHLLQLVVLKRSSANWTRPSHTERQAHKAKKSKTKDKKEQRRKIKTAPYTRRRKALLAFFTARISFLRQPNHISQDQEEEIIRTYCLIDILAALTTGSILRAELRERKLVEIKICRADDNTTTIPFNPPFTFLSFFAFLNTEPRLCKNRFLYTPKELLFYSLPTTATATELVAS